MLKIKTTVTLFVVLLAGFVLTQTSSMQQTPSGNISSPPQGLSGAVLYKNNCARCHGENGQGGKAPNLAAEKRQAKWKDSDEKLVKKITKGTWGMPAFGKKLKVEEIKAIADYVRSLKP